MFSICIPLCVEHVASRRWLGTRGASGLTALLNLAKPKTKRQVVRRQLNRYLPTCLYICDIYYVLGGCRSGGWRLYIHCVFMRIEYLFPIVYNVWYNARRGGGRGGRGAARV